MATGDTPAPSDTPDGRSPLLAPLDVLVGTWEMEARFDVGAFGPDSPAIVNRDGRTSFEWLDGRFFLVQRFRSDHPAAPNGIAIIGASGEEALVRHYFDSRGVARRYAMTLDDYRWTIQCESGGVHQRYRAEISQDGVRIEGTWESSTDGQDWHTDLELLYEKV